MSSYARPFHRSSRLRHLVAGAGAVVVLFLLGSTAVDGGAGDPGEPVTIAVDARDVPCDEPYDDRVELLPDTLGGKVRISVVVRNRDCCCCDAVPDGREGR